MSEAIQTITDFSAVTGVAYIAAALAALCGC